MSLIQRRAFIAHFTLPGWITTVIPDLAVSTTVALHNGVTVQETML